MTLEGHLRVATGNYSLKTIEHSAPPKKLGSAFPLFFFCGVCWKISKTTEKYERWKRSNLKEAYELFSPEKTSNSIQVKVLQWFIVLNCCLMKWLLALFSAEVLLLFP